ncbi:MAG: bifunctional pyr operon transcriptional regulator/uracil phosphoribosyltransferase PyrR [Fimbriimonadaceae bacterium]|nr:bifunctional pyr operon transcriptional regulator/uracil phosphoribosyltransferase PyrR [Fimbriimonadaceae bacterium]
MRGPLMDAEAMRRTLGRMAHEIAESHQGAEGVVCVGVLRRGYPLAKRLAFALTQIEEVTIPCGKLDVSAHRDDSAAGAVADASEIPFAIEGKVVILVDEVIATGRTTRAALEALLQFGRPRQVQLAVLIDRGGRELPLQPDFVGRTVSVDDDVKVLVQYNELDGVDAVIEREAEPA